MPATPTRRAAPTSRRTLATRASIAHPSQLLDWLRLAARQVFGAELAARIDPYRACRCCVSQVRWCGEGVPARLVPPAAAVPFVPDLGARMDLAMRQTLPGGPQRIGQGLRLEVSELFDSWHLGITPLTPSLILGAKADPYPLAEATQRRTRRLLEDVRENPSISGLEISILTLSPLLLRDLDLLVDLDQRHAVTVSVLIPAAEATLASRLEASAPSLHPVQSTHPALSPSASASPSAPPPPSPHARFELIHTLAAHGIATQVLCTPVQPGLNNSVAVLRRLFARAHDAGAFDVCPAPRHPALRPTATESRQLLALFHRLRLERGFPRTLPGRG